MIGFIKKYFTVIVTIFLVLVLLQECSTSRKVGKIFSEITTITNGIDTIQATTYTKDELDVQLKISGLEAEKRMIQSTDRKLWDMNRQSEIEKEIKELKGEK